MCAHQYSAGGLQPGTLQLGENKQVTIMKPPKQMIWIQGHRCKDTDQRSSLVRQNSVRGISVSTMRHFFDKKAQS